MTTIASDTGGKEFTPVPAGAHVAVCDQVIDLGIQDGGQYDPRQKIYLRWQIPGERVEWEKDGKKLEGPAVIGRKLTLSLSAKSNLRPLLESWRGRPFTDEERKGFDIKNVLGAACMIQVTHSKSQDGTRTFANVIAVMSLPKGIAKPAVEGSVAYYDCEQPDAAVYERLSKYIRGLIDARLTPEQAISKMKQADDPEPQHDVSDNSDIPF